MSVDNVEYYFSMGLTVLEHARDDRELKIAGNLLIKYINEAPLYYTLNHFFSWIGLSDIFEELGDNYNRILCIKHSCDTLETGGYPVPLHVKEKITSLESHFKP